MLVIVDYHTGNLGSIQNMLKKIGAKSLISSDKEKILSASKLILPGVGSFDYGMDQLHKLDLVTALSKKVLEDKTPILGICLGVQLFTKRSEEGERAGLGWVDATTKKFNFNKNGLELKIPHMGWNDVAICNQSKLMLDSPPNPRYYFVHSYHLEITNQNDGILECNYGYNFVCGIEKQNILGVQFHPEKSHRFGMQLLKNFVERY